MACVKLMLLSRTVLSYLLDLYSAFQVGVANIELQYK